jgi:SM-20-related protein
MDLHISRRLQFQQGQALVLDGLFSSQDIASAYGFLEQLPYRLNDVDSAETGYSRHWKAELPAGLALKTPLFRQCVEVTNQLMNAKPLRLCRVHSNLHLYGDMQFPHVDLEGGVTALYYANPEWEEKWLGETVFYDETREPFFTVAPKPGRLVLFDGDILHRAGVPSRECFQARISVAFKFVPAASPQ